MRWCLIVLGIVGLCYTSPAETAPPKVLVSIRPFHSLATNVMQGVGQPELLIQGIQSPHTFHLKPSDVKRIHNADLVVWVGPPLEFFLPPLAHAMKKQLQIIEIPNLMLLPLNDTAHQHGHGHDPKDSHHQVDPHIWLNPKNAILFVEALSKTLITMDPANAALYQRNATRLIKELTELDQELAPLLHPIQKQTFLVFHDSLQYFANHFGLTGLTMMTISPETPMTYQEIKKSEETIRTKHVKCIFHEPQFTTKIVTQLAERTGIKVDVLDPLGDDKIPDEQNYFTMMRTLADTLIDNLGQRLAPGVNP